MAIQESLVKGGISAVLNPSDAVSDVSIEVLSGQGALLESLAPGQVAWMQVSQETGTYSVSTPDAGISYRFRAPNGEANVYMGP